VKTFEKVHKYLRKIGEDSTPPTLEKHWKRIKPAFKHLDFRDPDQETCERMADILQMPEMEIVHTESANWFREQPWYKKVVTCVSPNDTHGRDLTENFMRRWVAWNWDTLSRKGASTLLAQLRAIEQNPIFEDSEGLQGQWLSIVRKQLRVPFAFVTYHFYLKTGVTLHEDRIRYILGLNVQKAGKDGRFSDEDYWNIRDWKKTQTLPEIAQRYDLHWRSLQRKFRLKEIEMVKEGKLPTKKATKKLWQSKEPKVRERHSVIIFVADQ
jgi:hypothetical protein